MTVFSPGASTLQWTLVTNFNVFRPLYMCCFKTCTCSNKQSQGHVFVQIERSKPVTFLKFSYTTCFWRHNSARYVLTLLVNKRGNYYNVYTEQSNCNCKNIITDSLMSLIKPITWWVQVFFYIQIKHFK